jgi:hypothetical protein
LQWYLQVGTDFGSQLRVGGAAEYRDVAHPHTLPVAAPDRHAGEISIHRNKC